MCLKEVVWKFEMGKKDKLTGTSAAYVADIQADSWGNYIY